MPMEPPPAVRFDLDGREGATHWHYPPARLYEEALRRNEAVLAAEGPLVARTGAHTGRSPNDRFVVQHEGSAERIDWGAVNRPISVDAFDRLLERARQHAHDRDLFVFDGYAGASPASRLKVRVITERAWHSLFAHNMFLREQDPAVLESFEPDYTVVDLPSLEADPERDETNSSTFILVDVDRGITLIGGTEYAGEIKKSIFGVMNYRLPNRGVLSMHCSANYGRDKGDSALFFGLSGTGKTTLSADASRTLIGDDEHGWNDDGIFNIEGGCYAKVIRLDPEGEPEIFATTRRFGTILENVVYDEATRRLDLDDDRHTENTRSSYPLHQITNADLEGQAGHPKTIVFLTCDAFGVLPPLSRLSPAQAKFHFLSGYTAKVAGTERGVTEPTATFSACFGAPFMPLSPSVYAKLLGEKIEQHDSSVWLVNTGWTGGPHGVGERISLRYTRRMIRAILTGELDGVETRRDATFGLEVPEVVDGVPATVLDPRSSWSDADAYDAQAQRLAEMFRENFQKFAADASPEVLDVVP